MSDNPWLLPAGVDELLPHDAWRLEAIRRRLLDLYASWGYELVIPPLIEYLESLLSGMGSDLDLQTFKLTDQLNGRLMGVRADMTPQVARIDSHRLQQAHPTRLCYLGPVLHTRPDGFAGSRCPMQAGAELYGHAGPESDAEVLCLMLATLQETGLQDIYIDLGHVDIYRNLAQEAGLDKDQEARLFDMLQRKALPEMHEFLAELEMPTQYKKMLSELVSLNGDADILARARQALSAAGPKVLSAIEEIEKVAEIVHQRMPSISLHYDLAELRGYHYQTGIVFAAFVPGHGQELARGGRYDDIGKVFGRPRPATGFSVDVRSIIRLTEAAPAKQTGILAPNTTDTALLKKIDALRASGERVIMALPGQEATPAELGCDRELQQVQNEWQINLVA